MRDLYDLLDYRKFIAEALRRRGGTQQDLAKAIGRAPSAVSLVLSDQRALDPELVDSIATFLGLDADLTQHLSALVDLHAPSPRARNSAWGAIRATQRHRAEAGLVEMESFDDWYFPVVMELAGCEGFRADPAWIAGSLVPPITVPEAANALSKAIGLGVLVESEDGTLSITQDVNATEQSVVDRGEAETVIAYYRECLQLAADSVEAADESERQLSTTVFRVSEGQLARIRARLREVEREIVMIAAEQVEATNRVYQLGIQLYPVSLFTDSTADHATFAKRPDGASSDDPE